MLISEFTLTKNTFTLLLRLKIYFFQTLIYNNKSDKNIFDTKMFNKIPKSQNKFINYRRHILLYGNVKSKYPSSSKIIIDWTHRSCALEF